MLFGPIFDRIKNNPAVVVAVVAAIVQALQAQDVLTWESALTVAVGVVIRQFVTPTARAEDQAERAFRLGTIAGRENP